MTHLWGERATTPTFFTPGGGTDTITEYADEGTDTLDYSAYTTPLVWNVGGGLLPGVNTPANVEKVVLGSGNDSLTGSNDDDVFVFYDGWGSDVVMDGTSSDSDTLDFSSCHKSLTFDFERETSTYTYTVLGTSETLSDVVLGLCNAINAGGKYTAAVADGKLVITGASAFAVAAVIPASGGTTITVAAAAGAATATLAFSGSAAGPAMANHTGDWLLGFQSESGANKATAAGIENVAGGSADDLFLPQRLGSLHHQQCRHQR